MALASAVRMARGSTPSEKHPSQNKPIRRADKLIQGARKGRRSDLEELFRKELPPLRRWAFANVPSSIRRAGNTDDFVQMAFLRTLRRLPHLNGANGGTLQPYLRRVLKNLIRDHARAAGRQPAMQALEEWAITAARPLSSRGSSRSKRMRATGRRCAR